MATQNNHRRRRPALARGIPALLTLTLACANAPADNTTVPVQAQVQQQQIQSQTQRVKDEIGAIVAEYQNNGLGNTEDAAVLTSIQKELGQLSQQQMEDVLKLLVAARQEQDPAKVRNTLVAAIKEQNEITLRLQQQLLQSQRQQDMAGMALRFNQLADRQYANLRMLRRYARLAAGATVFNLTVEQREYLQTQVTEQEMIGEEVRMQLGHLADLTRTTDPDTARRLAAMQQDAAADRLLDRLQDSGDELTRSQVGLAAMDERAIRDALRRMAQLGAAPMDSRESLRSAGESISRMIQQEQAIGSFGGEMAKLTDPSADMSLQTEEQQADLVDDADELSQALAPLDPESAHLLAGAVLQMQRVRGALLQKSQNDVVTHAAQARMELERALARISLTFHRMEKLASAPLLPERVAALRECIVALRVEQEQLVVRIADPGTAQILGELSQTQAALAGSTRDLLPFAEHTAPEVPALLGTAAQTMDQSALALGARGDAAAAHADALSAITALTKLESLLDARVQQLAAAQKDLDDLQQARQRLAWAILQQERLAVEVAQTDAQQATLATRPYAPAPPAATFPAASLAARETDIRSVAGAIQHLLAARVAAANNSLDQAQRDLSSALQPLEKLDAHAALPWTRSALADLDAARQALDPRMSDLRKFLELPEEPPTDLGDVAQAIQQIARDLQSPADPARQTAVALRDQERQMAADLHQLTPQFPQLEAAGNAADAAADRLDRNQMLDAARQTQAVLESMKPSGTAPQPPELADLTARQQAISQAVSQMISAADPTATQAAPATAPGVPLQNLPVSASQAAQLAGDALYPEIQDRGTVPAPIVQSLSAAEQALSDASARAAAGDQPGAKAARQRALQALQAGQNAVAAAQQAQSQLAALNAAPPQPGPNRPGPPQPSKANQPGVTPPTPNQPPGPGISDTGNPRDEHNRPGAANAGPAVEPGTAGFVHLPPRDRAAIEQSLHDQYPQEYAPLIENYFKNLSEQKE